MKQRDRFGLWPKQTRAQSGGAAEEGRAREAGKPRCQAQRRGEAAWPNARRTEGPFSTATREAEQGRPTGSNHIRSLGNHPTSHNDMMSARIRHNGGSYTFTARVVDDRFALKTASGIAEANDCNQPKACKTSDTLVGNWAFASVVAKGYFEPQEKAVCDKSEFGITANIWPRERVVV